MRWLRYPAALSVALTLSISAAMLIGRAQPLPERVALLHLNDLCKLPCWIGITPGVTTYEQARAIVRNVYGDRLIIIAGQCESDFCIADPQTSIDDFEVGFEVYNDIITYIYVTFYYWKTGYSVSTKGIFGIFGNPNYLTLKDLARGESASVYYLSQKVVIDIISQKSLNLAQNLPIFQIEIYEKMPDPYLVAQYGPYRWRGFGHTYK